MPWIQISLASHRPTWLRTEAIIGIALAERHGRGSQLLLISGATLDVTEEREELLQKIKELEGTAGKDRRVGFPAD